MTEYKNALASYLRSYIYTSLSTKNYHIYKHGIDIKSIQVEFFPRYSCEDHERNRVTCQCSGSTHLFYIMELVHIEKGASLPPTDYSTTSEYQEMQLYTCKLTKYCPEGNSILQILAVLLSGVAQIRTVDVSRLLSIYCTKPTKLVSLFQLNGTLLICWFLSSHVLNKMC